MSFKKVMLIGIGILAAAMAFAAGAKDEGSTTPVATAAPVEQVTINFWTWRPEDVESYNKLIATFEGQNPGVKVVQTAHKNTEYNTILSAALSGGSGPDVF